MIQKEENKQSFLQHISSVDPAILLTVENNKEDDAIPFLDTIVKPEADGKLSITVYRKPTHVNLYLQWDSHDHLSAKYMSLVLSPLGPKLFAAILSCSKRNGSPQEGSHQL